MTVTRPATILGGLPMIATVAFSKDADTPNGPGEYWAEVEEIQWMRRDGSAGKSIPDKVRDRAEKYDYGFCDLIEAVIDALAHERWMRKHPDGDDHQVSLG